MKYHPQVFFSVFQPIKRWFFGHHLLRIKKHIYGTDGWLTWFSDFSWFEVLLILPKAVSNWFPLTKKTGWLGRLDKNHCMEYTESQWNLKKSGGSFWENPNWNTPPFQLCPQFGHYHGFYYIIIIIYIYTYSFLNPLQSKLTKKSFHDISWSFEAKWNMLHL